MASELFDLAEKYQKAPELKKMEVIVQGQGE